MRYDCLTEVANYATAVEAELTRNILAEHGIEAVVDGADLGTFLSLVGSALGGVKVLVEKEDLNEARQIVLDQRELNNDLSPSWIAHLYSMFLLLRASTITGKFTNSGKRRFYFALAINILSPLLWLWMIFS